MHLNANAKGLCCDKTELGKCRCNTMFMALHSSGEQKELFSCFPFYLLQMNRCIKIHLILTQMTRVSVHSVTCLVCMKGKINCCIKTKKRKLFLTSSQLVHLFCEVGLKVGLSFSKSDRNARCSHSSFSEGGWLCVCVNVATFS